MKSRHNPVFRPATKKDVEEFYPEASQTFHAYVVEINGEVLGIGGIYYIGNFLVAFAKNKPELDAYPFTKARGAKKIMNIIGDRYCIAFADTKIPEAPKLLERLGFQHVEGNTYQWMS